MDILKLLSDQLDNRLLDLIKNGRKIMTKDGDLVQVEATAADLNIVRQRLKDCGISTNPTEENPIGAIINEMKANGHKFKANLPALDTEESMDGQKC
jgi:S1-C subfamily serine protease